MTVEFWSCRPDDDGGKMIGRCFSSCVSLMVLEEDLGGGAGTVNRREDD